MRSIYLTAMAITTLILGAYSIWIDPLPLWVITAPIWVSALGFLTLVVVTVILWEIIRRLDIKEWEARHNGK